MLQYVTIFSSISGGTVIIGKNKLEIPQNIKIKLPWNKII